MEPSREIPQRELRNDVARVLKDVAGGQTLRVTVHGRPVADLVPISETRRYATAAEVERIIKETPLDAAFLDDVHAALASTVDEL